MQRTVRHVSFLMLVIILWITTSSALAQKTTEGILSDSVPADDLAPTILLEWMQRLYDRIEADGVSAPGASRLYAYAAVAAYESVLPGMVDNFTLNGQLNDFPVIPYPEEDAVHDWVSVANAALSTVLEGLFYDQSDESRESFAELREAWIARRQGDVTPDVIERSTTYGDRVGELILNWALEDGYIETRGREYTPPVGPQFWIPTQSEVNSVEPYWGELRTFALAYADECAFYRDYEFSTDPDSVFYAQAYEVYEVGQNLTPEQQEIARFWVDTPGQTGTPSGHWILIQMAVAEDLDMSLNRAVEMFLKTNVAMADAFIATWSLKYQDPLLRPETYITEYIDPRWSPYIASPNFPEYPSGHSVVSGAAAQVLQDMFGQHAFTSVTFPSGVRMQRSFNSFAQAAQEAAMSRMYGGIHYRAAIENGLRQGQCIGSISFDRIIMRSIPQGE